MQDKLQALGRLAKMDDSTREVEAQLAQVPKSLTELKQSVSTLEMLLERERTQLQNATELHESQKEDLRTRNEALANARKKLAQATNVREADAAEKEIASNRRAIKDREEEIERLGVALEAKLAAMAQRENDFLEAQGVLENEDAGVEGRLSVLRDELAKLAQGRETLVAQIPTAVLKRYDRFRKSVRNMVIPLSTPLCPGCRMSVPAQLFNEVQRAEDFQQCPHCQRFVMAPYVVESIADSFSAA